VRCCGRLTDDYAREVWVKHPSVSYRWLDKMEDYFRLLAECDIVFNVRTDAEASRYRSLVFPQKLFDALAVGRPVLVASENWVAQWVKEHGVGYSCSFGDPEQMGSVLLSCRERRNELPGFSHRARELFKSTYQWSIMEQRLIKMYASLGTTDGVR
jgi:glycosyltransferase involved in cell wall biosynthesis